MEERVIKLPLMYKAKINFEEDWTNIQKEELRKFGFSIPTNMDKQQISISYFNLLHRLIDARPRKVYISKELKCPKKHKMGFDALVKKIEKGIDLTPHISTNILDLNYKDGLLNDWGIYHLHLGTQYDDKGFVNRTGSLLFARFTKKEAYLLKIMPHKKWGNRDLIKIIHNNWPETIQHFRINLLEISPNPSDREIIKFRDNGLMYSVKLDDGTIYAPVGLGYATDGTSILVSRRSDETFNAIKEYEKYINENLMDIVSQFKNDGLKIKPTLVFELKYRDGFFYAVEKNSGGYVPLGNPFLI
jgi:hypothetical protein